MQLFSMNLCVQKVLHYFSQVGEREREREREPQCYDKIVPFRNRFQVYFVLETIIFSNDGIFIELIHFLLTLDPVAGTNIKK